MNEYEQLTAEILRNQLHDMRAEMAEIWPSVKEQDITPDEIVELSARLRDIAYEFDLSITSVEEGENLDESE